MTPAGERTPMSTQYTNFLKVLTFFIIGLFDVKMFLVTSLDSYYFSVIRAEVRRSFITKTVLEESQVTSQGHHQ